MIAVIDYGLGNISAFTNIYRRLGVDVQVARSAQDVERATRIVLPGVGAFDWAMDRLNRSGMRDALDEMVLRNQTPVLGVCVGMQMMAQSSDEGKLHGLGWFDAEVYRIDTTTLPPSAHLPHMGWNDVNPAQHTRLFDGLNAARFYFLHSYFVQTHSPDDVAATSVYGSTFASAIAKRNIFGTQFHPEKSHHWGVQLLKNFAEL